MNAQQRLAAQRKQQAAATGATANIQNLNRPTPNPQQQQQQAPPINNNQQQQQQQMQLPPGITQQQLAILQHHQQIVQSGGQLTPQQIQLHNQIMMRIQQHQNLLRAQSRADAFLTETEVEGFEQSDDSAKGSGFRKLLAIFLIISVLLLAGVKLFDEATVVEPGVGGADDFASSTSAAETNPDEVVAAESTFSFLSALGLSKEDRFKEKPANRKETKAEKEERLRENWQKMQKIKEHLTEIKTEQSALVYCGQECQDSGKQVQAAYDALASRVERPLTEALFGEEDSAKININRLTDKQIREQYEKKKKEIEETIPENSEDRKMYLAEIKDAAEIMQNAEARKYYLMYNQKPPEHVKHVKSTHGGWGQELALKTFRNRMVMGWLQHMESAWADWTVIGMVIGIGYLIPMIFTVPKAIAIAEQMVEEHEKMEALEQEAMENKKNE